MAAIRSVTRMRYVSFWSSALRNRPSAPLHTAVHFVFGGKHGLVGADQQRVKRAAEEVGLNVGDVLTLAAGIGERLLEQVLPRPGEQVVVLRSDRGFEVRTVARPRG